VSSLDYFHNPMSVAVVGASDDPEKIGGRPLRYLREFGFAGTVVAVNPKRDSVQGLATVPRLQDSPVVPDVALIAVPGQAAVDAVRIAAEMGTKGAIVMSSGFGETHTAEGLRMQEELLGHARGTGMRVVGPNSQGLASFHSGAVMGFSTLFTEEPPADGPVGIVSQSGALASVPYGILRRRGIGIRYAHGTGNDLDVTAAELAAAAAEDPELRLLLLYLENVGDPESLVALGETSRRRGVPVVALVGGRSQSGSRAAASHTGALATERRVLDAFFERVGIWQVHSVRELVAASELYLQEWTPTGDGLAVVSNSGAICVLAADAAADAGLPLASLADQTVAGLKSELPAFAATANPVDVTAALLTDSGLFGRVLPILGADPSVDACLLGIPVAGRGYDVERFARDASGTPIVCAIPQPKVAAPFVAAGVPVFEEEASAIAALAQYLAHRARMTRAETLPRPALGPRPGEARSGLNEAQSLAALADLGIPVVPHELVTAAADVAAAYDRLSQPLGADQVVVKGSSPDATHKSELGLVRLRIGSRDEAVAAAEEIAASADGHEVTLDGFLVAPMVRGLHEGLVGASLDPVFGPVMVVGAGGVYVEATPDTQVLLAPCTIEEVHEALGRLRLSPLLAGVRGEPAVDVESWAKAVVSASQVLADPACEVAGFDANPLMLLEDGVVAVDAVVLHRKESLVAG
jgi:acyl-CoA synthetase (NDP forming)